MSAPVRERDVVLRERNAYFLGASSAVLRPDRATIELAAQTRYPLPRVTRTRVVADAFGAEWKVSDGILWNRRRSEMGWSDRDRAEDGWTDSLLGKDGGYFYPTPERIRLWADLLANPTEEVDA